MAKMALVLVFSLMMVLSIRGVLGEDALSPEQVNKATSTFKEATQSVSSTAGTAAESVKETALSWSDWAKDKLRDYGVLSPQPSASAPENAPSPAFTTRSLGPGYADAPMFM